MNDVFVIMGCLVVRLMLALLCVNGKYIMTGQGLVGVNNCQVFTEMRVSFHLLTLFKSNLTSNSSRCFPPPFHTHTTMRIKRNPGRTTVYLSPYLPYLYWINFWIFSNISCKKIRLEFPTYWRPEKPAGRKHLRPPGHRHGPVLFMPWSDVFFVVGRLRWCWKPRTARNQRDQG